MTRIFPLDSAPLESVGGKGVGKEMRLVIVRSPFNQSPEVPVEAKCKGSMRPNWISTLASGVILPPLGAQ
jgi:hypothetical protein